MSASEDELISLVLDSAVRVAGEEVRGEVLLNFKHVQRAQLEEVQVKFVGAIHTYGLCLFLERDFRLMCEHLVVGASPGLWVNRHSQSGGRSI